MAKTKRVTKRQEMAARAIVQRAKDQQDAAVAAERRKLIGRCFKYRNRYSDGEAWWLYALVTGLDEYGRVSSLQVQHTSNETISVDADRYGALLPDGGWQEITREEFRAAAVEIASAFLGRIGLALSADAVDPQADSTGKPSTREKSL